MKKDSRFRISMLPLFLSAMAFAYSWNVNPASATHLTGHSISEIASVDCGLTDVTIHFSTGIPVTATQAYTLTAPNKLRYYVGASGEDVMKGTSSHDTMVGYGGDDVFCGFGGGDTISAGDGNDIVVGGDGNDKMAGDGGNDYLEGDAGNDTLSGSVGPDILNGGDGTDICSGGSGTDTTDGSCETASSIEIKLP
jgi:hypothetical protein